jgi:enoyl-CoA hydratase/carnithine racemase
VCTTRAKFAFLFTKVGLSGGDMGAAYLLPRMVGVGRATELLMLGDTIDAETADRYGLVSQLVDEDGLDDAVDARRPTARRRADAGVRADEVADHPRAGHADRSAMELDAMTQALLMTTHDHAEFTPRSTRSAPEWTG